MNADNMQIFEEIKVHICSEFYKRKMSIYLQSLVLV